MQDNPPEKKSKLLVANPGTGKTTELSREVARLLREGVPASDILCLTFTVKATEEMLRKIRESCLQNGIDDLQVHDLEVSTFHSFAWKYVSEASTQRPLASANLLRYSILKSAYRHRPFNYPNSYIAEEIVPKIENSIRYVKSFGVLPSMMDEETIAEILSEYWKSSSMSQLLSFPALMVYLKFFIKAYEEYEESKKNKFVDYNDILIEYLSLPEDVKKVYRYILVDELQDVNEIEARIIEQAGQTKFLVGDRKQSIFGFQGGSLSVFRRYVDDDSYKKQIMGQNHRSTEEILNFSKEFFRNVEDSEIYEQELGEFVSEGRHGPPVKVIISDSGVSSAVNLIIEHRDGKFKGKSVALITRTNDQLIQASKIMEEQKVKYTSTAPPALSVEARDDILKFLRGLFHDDVESILNALYTPFSGITLKDAFAISTGLRSREIKEEDLPAAATSFYELRERVKTIEDLETVFVERIIPSSVSLGRDYTLTVMSMSDSIVEFFSQTSNPDFDDLTDFLLISEGEYEPLHEKGNIVLTTVHKAKGLEFDHVIYVPSRRRNRTRFFDAVTRAVLRSVRNIDISTELSGEDDRVDFVAFTRARDSLTVVSDERQRTRYSLNNFCETDYSDERSVSGIVPAHYSEAYSMFVAGKYDEARKMLESNWEWIKDEVKNHFRNLNHLSFSSIEGIEDPMNYLLQSIFRVPSTAYPLKFGSRVHEIAQNIFEEKEVRAESQELEQIKENINALLWTISNTRSMERAYAEKKVLVDVSEAFSDFSDFKGVNIIAYLDAVFKSKSEDRYLIVDYKTDRSQNNGSKHRRQLLFYRALLSSYLSVPESDIETAIAYVSLRESVNTGQIEYLLDDRPPATDAIETVKRKMSRFLHFRNDPDSFIDYLVKKYRTNRYSRYPSIADSIVSSLNGNR